MRLPRFFAVLYFPLRVFPESAEEPRILRRSFLARRNRFLIVALAFASVFGGAGATAAAQSVTAGTVTGVVRDTSGAPLPRAFVTLTERATGLSRTADAPVQGVFEFPLLPVGQYQAVVEALGYGPVLVTGIQVEPGHVTTVTAVLTTAVLPANNVRMEPSTARGGALSAAGVTRVAGSLELRHSPGEPFPVQAGDNYLPSAGMPHSVDGLPGSMTRFVLDGLPWKTARNPWLQADPGPGVSTWTLDRAQLSTNDIDVEWSALGAGQLSAFSRRGTTEAPVQAFGGWSGDIGARSRVFGGSPPRFSSWSGGVEIGATVIRDTAQMQIGGDAERTQIPLPRVWIDPLIDGTLGAVAQDSFGVSLAPYLQPRVATVTRARPVGRLAWKLGGSHSLFVLAAADIMSAVDADLGEAHAPGVGVKLTAHSFLGGVTLSSVMGSRAWNEMRVAVDGSARDYVTGSLPATRIVDAGVLLGTDPAAAGSFARTGLTASEVLAITLGEHRFKLGLGAAAGFHNYSFGYRRNGEYTFASAGDLAAGRGVYVQSVGPLPAARFTTGNLTGLAQDVWTVAPGFEFQIGFRFDMEFLPWNRVILNEAWLTQTGIPNIPIDTLGVRDRTLAKFGPRVGFTWRVGRDGAWVVRGRAGVSYDEVDPGLIHELITSSGRFETRRGVGFVSRWPVAPDSTNAPVVGRQLTLLGSNFLPPRNGRASLGLSWLPSPAAAFHASTGVRRTSFLTRRHDLNRLGGIAGRDQFGRALYGTVTQQGGLLIAQPGTNRRFSGFDVVSAMDTDGLSNYWDVTVGLERRAGTVFRFSAWYTYSKTTDNWLAGQAGGPEGQLSPFPDSLDGQDWAEGRSDFDVPHRVGLVADLSPFRAAWAGLSLRYSYLAGQPFTPGFRAGVDANGDGSGANDPAFVDDRLSGMDQLLAAWSCLRPFVGRFVERNACREAGAHHLDLRLTIRPVRLEPLGVALVIDGLNLLDDDGPVRDRALYLIDAGGALSTNSATGIVNVPVTTNPRFGQVVERRGSGRQFRLGVRIS